MDLGAEFAGREVDIGFCIDSFIRQQQFAPAAFKTEIAAQIILARAGGEFCQRGHGGVAVLLPGNQRRLDLLHQNRGWRVFQASAGGRRWFRSAVRDQQL